MRQQRAGELKNQKAQLGVENSLNLNRMLNIQDYFKEQEDQVLKGHPRQEIKQLIREMEDYQKFLEELKNKEDLEQLVKMIEEARGVGKQIEGIRGRPRQKQGKLALGQSRQLDSVIINKQN